MTAAQNKRIRAKLAKAHALTVEAYELTQLTCAPIEMLRIAGHAADRMRDALGELEYMDQRNRQHADAVAKQLREEFNMTEDEKQSWRRFRNDNPFKNIPNHVRERALEIHREGGADFDTAVTRAVYEDDHNLIEVPR